MWVSELPIHFLSLRGHECRTFVAGCQSVEMVTGLRPLTNSCSHSFLYVDSSISVCSMEKVRVLKSVCVWPGSHQAVPPTPYSLPCVRELLRFLVSLINPYDQHNTDVMIHMGLSLLTIALESGADHIARFQSLLALVKDEMAKNLVFVSTVHSIVNIAHSRWCVSHKFKTWSFLYK